MTHFHIVTLFPEMFDSYLGESIIARAIREKKIKVSFYNPRDFTKDKHKRVDDKSYGGGPGMVMQVEPILRAVDKAVGKKEKVKCIVFSPQGKELTNTYAKGLQKKFDHVVMIAGRYEGIDHRVKKILKADEVSIGNFVLTGGELAAMVTIDVVTRQITGALGNTESLEEGRSASKEIYTRPEVFSWKGKEHKVPKVLLSGDHAKIEEWRKKRSKSR